MQCFRVSGVHPTTMAAPGVTVNEPQRDNREAFDLVRFTFIKANHTYRQLCLLFQSAFTDNRNQGLPFPFAAHPGRNFELHSTILFPNLPLETSTFTIACITPLRNL